MRGSTKLLLAAAVAAAVAFAPRAEAQATKTGTFVVSSTVAKACSTVTATDVDLGVYDPTGTGDKSGTSTISVKCVKGTDYTIGLTSAHSWSLKGPGASDLIAYKIYQPGGVIDWTANALAVAAVTNSSAINYTATVKATQGQDVSVGAYSDTVTVTVTY